jgi:Ser/Thr protein kinase RdoA (MazF antagonist)
MQSNDTLLINETGKRMDNHPTVQHSRIDAALAAQLEILRGGISGASTYRVFGLSEPCILKVVEAESAEDVRARAYREIHFYNHLAACIPLSTPRVFASLTEKSGYCALLIAAYQPLKPANQLPAADFTEIAIQLARFHALFWNRTEQLATHAWLAKPPSPDLTNDARHARETWLALAQRPQFREILTEATLQAIETALGDVQTKAEYGPDTPMTLCHGDCHLDNLLRDQEGHLIWADWQEVRIGYGPSDLTFLMQRAEANGADIAHDSVVAAYCKALKAAGIEDVNQCTITSAMQESERRTRLLYWPDYMSDATTERMAHHLTRIFPAHV